jgi:hypothetical protein
MHSSIFLIMEYLLVVFDERRGVLVNNIEEGFTNEVVELETGTHIISLVDPKDFTPELREIILRRTTATRPKEIRFEKV